MGAIREQKDPLMVGGAATDLPRVGGGGSNSSHREPCEEIFNRFINTDVF